MSRGLLIAALALGAALLFAVFAGGQANGEPVPVLAGWLALSLAGLALVVVATTFALGPQSGGASLFAAATLLAAAILSRLYAGVAFDGWAPVVVLIVVAGVACVALAAYAKGDAPLARWLVPTLFAGAILFLWEAITVGYRVPGILLPSPSAIGRAFSAISYDLTQDFWQTVVREALPGFVIGSAAGLAVAFAADRSRFLRDGLLPIGNWVGVMPIVGIAPFMVMWFGFGWESKAGVVVLMTFFPTLVTTLAGLRLSQPLEHDLMASYSASHGQTLLKLRLPAAMPFILSALKLNASFALIGSIVAEYFGTPTYGLGFRISTEVGRLNLDRVWAAIVIAALTGTLAYAGLSLAERIITFWHPSQLRRGTPQLPQAARR